MIEITLLNSIVDTSNLPEGFWLASAVGINDWGVVVGYALNGDTLRIPYAVDLSFGISVVDLLPKTGSTFDYASRINNRGEIGDPATRIMRDVDNDGVPVAPDMSQESPISLEEIVGPTFISGFIGNPSVGGTTFIGGTSTIDDVPFRLAIGPAGPEPAEFLTHFISDGGAQGMDSDGALQTTRVS